MFYTSLLRLNHPTRFRTNNWLHISCIIFALMLRRLIIASTVVSLSSLQSSFHPAGCMLTARACAPNFPRHFYLTILRLSRFEPRITDILVLGFSVRSNSCLFVFSNTSSFSTHLRIPSSRARFQYATAMTWDTRRPLLHDKVGLVNIPWTEKNGSTTRKFCLAGTKRSPSVSSEGGPTSARSGVGTLATE